MVERQAVAHGQIEASLDELAREMPRELGVAWHLGERALAPAFVRDFVLLARVGAYAHEREKPQNVCFNVDVKVRRTDHSVEDMRDVFSYDVITDGIRIIVTREHIAFLETLAERVAMSVLAHPRAVSVMVRVEKLDLGSGGVGVEIVRERPVDVAKIHHLYPAAAGQT